MSIRQLNRRDVLHCAAAAAASGLTVVQNWFEELTARVPVP